MEGGGGQNDSKIKGQVLRESSLLFSSKEIVENIGEKEETTRCLFANRRTVEPMGSFKEAGSQCQSILDNLGC